MSTVHDQSTAEYDAFGPWIDEVRSIDDVPRLYRGHPIDFASARTVLKFPRDVSRREANPQMDLYDHLLVAGLDTLTVLSRVDGAYTELTIAYREIAAITDWVNLLDAQLSIFALSGEVVAVPYNGSSRDTVGHLVDMLRGLALSTRTVSNVALPGMKGALELDDLGKKDALFVTAYRDRLRREPGLQLLAAHGRVAVARRGGLVARLVDLVLPVTLHGALLCASPAELQVLSRRHWLVRGTAPVFSLARTVMPLDLIQAVTVAAHPRYVAASIVTMRLADAVIEVVVPTGSAAQETLLALQPTS